MMERLELKSISSLVWLTFYHNFDENEMPEVQKLLDKDLTVAYANFYFTLGDIEKERRLQLVPFLLSE